MTTATRKLSRLELKTAIIAYAKANGYHYETIRSNPKLKAAAIEAFNVKKS